MLTLHLGVVDVGYGDAGAKGANTTGEVAEILESNYSVMAIFRDTHMKLLMKTVEDALDRSFHETSRTRKVAPVITDIMLGPIESSFRDFITSREIEFYVGGPTEAASSGVSHRFKDADNRAVSVKKIVSGTATTYMRVAKRKRDPRPSFVDTGLYVASFRAWLTK
jgi:hypothetical protein